MSSTPQRPLPNGHHPRLNGANGTFRKSANMTRDGAMGPAPAVGSEAEEEGREDDVVHLLLRAKWAQTEASIASLFGTDGQTRRASRNRHATNATALESAADFNSTTSAPAPVKKPARQIDEDDYGDEEDEEEESAPVKDSLPKAKAATTSINGFLTPNGRTSNHSGMLPIVRTNTSTSSEPIKSSEDVRKQLAEEKKEAAETARRSFQSMFYTLESDRDAMLEQQKLDELDREVENELSGAPNGTQGQQRTGDGSAVAAGNQGTLGSADLGASSLTLKHLIARIDHKRDMVQASDAQLRTLISEVRKGRSKWASEERIGQEELYEAAEKVLLELKAMTEYAQPFLQRVSKREAPDYFNVIKHPMDLNTMSKKLLKYAYKSKDEFVSDLDLIWANCLKYNQEQTHPLRRKALYMRKETAKLTPLIPDITVKDRAEVEAAERRLHAVDDESDEDDAPIMASRGRKAPKKGGKGVPSSTKRAPAVAVDETTSTPAPDVKPAMHAAASNLRAEFLRADSEAHEASSAGFSTPQPGTATPMPNGFHHSAAAGSQVDQTEVDGLGQSIISSTEHDEDEDDTELKTWKQVTKKDRAQVASERHRLFHGEQYKNLNLDEPALLRSKASMRRWMRQQEASSIDKNAINGDAEDVADTSARPAQGESLAEGIEKDEDSTLPDYYTSLSAIPDIQAHWKWQTDSEGFAAPQTEQWMRMYPKDMFKSTEGVLKQKMEANMRQMQDTRKVCAKIGIVKQMQIQAQTYQNQFQKYEAQPLVEQDAGGVVLSENGPPIAPWVCRKTLQRSVGKIFYHAGFEDYQPSALDAVTDLASEYLGKLVDAFKCYREQPRKGKDSASFTFEEQVLHSLHEHGTDLESLDTYVKDDVERLSTKLGVVHDRMKLHLADLLRPALPDQAGTDGVGAFNDGSDQFVGGDFAEELDEDFFGLRELGLAQELGLESLSVPLHLLQTRMHSAYQAQNQGAVTNTGMLFPTPPPYEPITVDNVSHQIGLVQDFFRNKLHNNHDEPLVEDEDLPQKQRFPRPRLPANGKISSPRKRPLREQQQAAKKKRKLEDQEQAKTLQPPIGKLRLEMPSGDQSRENDGEPEKEAEANGSMISPESIAAN